MPPVGFEPTISADERPQTYALDRVATGTGGKDIVCSKVFISPLFFLKILFSEGAVVFRKIQYIDLQMFKRRTLLGSQNGNTSNKKTKLVSTASL